MDASAIATSPSVLSLRGSRMKVGFLFNHRIHQVPHAAPVAFELSRRHPEIAVTAIAANRENLHFLEAIAAQYPAHRCRLVQARIPAALRVQHALLRRRRSIEKRAVLRYNLPLFAELDALAVPELTSLKLKKVYGLDRLRMISLRHGAGDRPQSSLDERLREFDLVLLPGRKTRDRLQALGHLREGSYRVIGYPKFDLVGRLLPSGPAPFGSPRPIVLYNPHFDPKLSSWHTLGVDVLDFFSRSDRYNVIFAPHLMLFERSWKFRARLPRRYRRCESIHIDTGSLASVDMSYTMAADIYLGDVSSQVYEFLLKPRPCIFLNGRGIRWQGDPNYAHWRFGPVVTDVSGLEEALAGALETHASYLAAQREAFADTFDLSPEPSAARAADAIASFLGTASQRSEG
jgi:hypothetical protein